MEDERQKKKEAREKIVGEIFFSRQNARNKNKQNQNLQHNV
jgi:hypothetical protein